MSICLGFERKKVSCMSLVGWSCGEKRASKTQKALSTIGPSISEKPMLSHALLTMSMNSCIMCCLAG